MSALTLREAIVATLQTDTETRYGTGTHRGDSLGSFRSLDHFIGEWPGRHSEAAANSEARALLAQIRPLVGHRVVEVGIEDIDPGLSPAPVLRFDDGRILTILADPEGNGGGFPDIIKP